MTDLLATYRLQLRAEFTFADAQAIVPYLRDLGVSHLYLSPILQAREGSTHGYDVADPRQVSRALGGEAGLRALAAEGMPIIVDIVPNHMAATDENPFWRDPALRAQFFDLDPHGGHRRFFDVDELGGVRVEDPEVFAITHGKILELVRDGVVAGVRVDHIDGLADPAGYLERLRAAGVEIVWVEKILEEGEVLRPWPVDGTTGYEYLVDADALFVDGSAHTAFDHLDDLDVPAFADLAAAAKREAVASTFQPEVARLQRIAPLPDLADALAALPIYRTYLRPGARVAEADESAIRTLPGPVADALLGRVPVPEEFVVRFQQTTPAVMAKGVEDTALYRHVRLLALNEVGGRPDRFGMTVDEFNTAALARQANWPRNLLAATTHDTKRSADTRARIVALTALTSEWQTEVAAARAVIAELRRAPAPDALEERFILQTLVGAWPIDADRLGGYLEKALREAKRNTSWVDPDVLWERNVIDTTLLLVHDPRFLARFLPFLERVDDVAARIIVGQTALRVMSPGVPDVYQGDEMQNRSLVDPDNRRPVGYDARRHALASLRAEVPPDRETAKLFTLTTLLALRARHPDFVALPYHPSDQGPDVCAFARGDDILVLVPVHAPFELPPRPPIDDFTDVLAPLDVVFGSRRPAVYERRRSRMTG
ncbi:MAG TPA: alpha-amylase family glycosyl hydrolase [Acidimicrobiia bacterium]|nr:alpha-amylase family glycosyl hydrolase [Acidimicrobiia bacterium]